MSITFPVLPGRSREILQALCALALSCKRGVSSHAPGSGRRAPLHKGKVDQGKIGYGKSDRALRFRSGLALLLLPALLQTPVCAQESVRQAAGLPFREEKQGEKHGKEQARGQGRLAAIANASGRTALHAPRQGEDARNPLGATEAAAALELASLSGGESPLQREARPVCLPYPLLRAGAPRQRQTPSGPAKDDLTSPFAAFRLGIIASPVASFDGGIDVTLPQWGVNRQWAARIDIDVAARFRSPSFGSRRDASVGLTFCQVYTPGGVNRGNLYGGLGIGPFFGTHSALGGKLFVGSNFTPVVSIEIEGQFPGDSTARVVAMMRLSAL